MCVVGKPQRAGVLETNHLVPAYLAVHVMSCSSGVRSSNPGMSAAQFFHHNSLKELLLLCYSESSSFNSKGSAVGYVRRTESSGRQPMQRMANSS